MTTTDTTAPEPITPIAILIALASAIEPHLETGHNVAHATLRAEHERLFAEHVAMCAKHDQLSAEHVALRAAYDQLLAEELANALRATRDYEKIQGELRAIARHLGWIDTPRVGGVEQMVEAIDALRAGCAEIDRLRSVTRVLAEWRESMRSLDIEKAWSANMALIAAVDAMTETGA